MFGFLLSPIPRLLRAADSVGLADLLRKQPALEADFLQRAQTALQNNKLVDAIVLTLALARRNADSAQRLLGLLLSQPDWRRVHAALDDEEVICLLLYLIGRRSPLAHALFGACKPEQTAGIEQTLQTTHPDAWFDLLWQRADGTTAEILARLRAQPHLQQRFLDRTRVELARGHSGEALRVLHALRGCDSSLALPLLTDLVSTPDGVRGLDTAGASDLIAFAHQQSDLLLPLLRGLSAETFAGLSGHLTGSDLEAWANLALERDELYAVAADRLAGLTRRDEAVPLASDPAVLNSALDAALGTLEHELRKPLLTGDGEQVLRRVWLLTRLCQRRLPLDLARLLAGCLERLSVAGLWAGAGLLGQLPQREWIPPLRAAWFRLEALSHAQQRHHRARATTVPLAVLELAAFEVAGAIGPPPPRTPPTTTLPPTTTAWRPTKPSSANATRWPGSTTPSPRSCARELPPPPPRRHTSMASGTNPARAGTGTGVPSWCRTTTRGRCASNAANSAGPSTASTAKPRNCTARFATPCRRARSCATS